MKKVVIGILAGIGILSILLLVGMFFVFKKAEQEYNSDVQTTNNLKAPIEIPSDGVVKYSEIKDFEKPMLVMFYVDWCGYCRRYMPIFGELAKEYADKYGIHIISFVVPTSEDRIKQIAKEATGFIYFVPSIGSTSALGDNSREVMSDIELIKQVTDIPIAIGFGINTPAQAEYFSKIADGIIIGNAIVKIVEKHGKDAPAHVFDYVKEMKAVLL